MHQALCENARTPRTLMKQSTTESKHERFVRLAEARTNKIIATLRLLGNCSSQTVYEYSKSDVTKIFRAIDDAVSDAKRRFNKQESGNKLFRLS